MTKYDFMNELNAHLKGKISTQELNDLMNYYQEYIDTQIRKGKTEEEVLEELGSPRLLAKSIVQTKGVNDMEQDSYRTFEEEEQVNSSSNKIYFGDKGYPLPLVIAIAVIILVLVLALVLHIIVFLAPAILVLAVVLFLYRLITKGR